MNEAIERERDHNCERGQLTYALVRRGGENASLFLWARPMAMIRGAVSYTHLTLPATPYV